MTKMSVNGIGQNYYHNNVATVRNTKNVNSTGKNDGFAGKVTEKNPVSPEDMTLEEYKAYCNEKMNFVQKSILSIKSKMLNLVERHWR